MMSTQFNDLTKGLVQSATRRQTLKKFGVALAGMALVLALPMPTLAQVSQQCPFISGFDGLFLGEYFGLAAAGNAFVAAFAAVDQNGLTGAFARRVGP